MPKLQNPRHELFAKLSAEGMKRGPAYVEAGFHPSTMKGASQAGTRLMMNPAVRARTAEIKDQVKTSSLAAVNINRTWVLAELKDNIERAKAHKPVLDRAGNETGEYKQELPAANRGLELIGKELGMFADRLILDDLDEQLEGMSGKALREYVRAAASEVGLRVVDMNDEETRTYIFKTAPRVGLRVTESRPDPDSTETAEDRALRSLSQANGVSRSRLQ